MIVKNILSQHRRDFTAMMICEHCNHEVKLNSGYDDDNYHRNVIPAMACPKCGETAAKNYRPMTTKYAAGEVV